jgi:tRNA(Ile)-lysidine synthase
MKAVLERDSIRILTAPDEKEKQIPIVVGVSIDVAGLIISVKNIPMKKNHLNSDPTIEYIDADKIEGEMTLRTWKAGDHFFPIGMNRRKKISDFLTDEKTPVTLKKHQLVLSDAKKILWVVGKRLDERVKLTSQTKRVLELRVKKNG